MIENKSQNQILTIENRKVFAMTGVTDIESSNDSVVRLGTNLGKLIIYGSSLSIGKISVDTGEFTLTGNIDKLEYKNSGSKGKLASVFK